MTLTPAQQHELDAVIRHHKTGNRFSDHQMGRLHWFRMKLTSGGEIGKLQIKDGCDRKLHQMELVQHLQQNFSAQEIEEITGVPQLKQVQIKRLDLKLMMIDTPSILLTELNKFPEYTSETDTKLRQFSDIEAIRNLTKEERIERNELSKVINYCIDVSNS
ncbi:hypothetical protein MK852_23795 [Shewanella benthica]|uniref:hypothetical protein n=1 Tax=Shewanella benthica TaxID=43661 RepID=UPI00187ADF04|nr:hypothetical protein [Shewanella benthica]MBE7216380.1 hypothetical protein [Shewanella benthica]MCL1065118.1 hypothetical protein [Shewanella benthica]